MKCARTLALVAMTTVSGSVQAISCVATYDLELGEANIPCLDVVPNSGTCGITNIFLCAGPDKRIETIA